MNWLKQISRLIACFFVVTLMPRNALALVDEADPFIPQLIPIELQAWWLPDFGHIHAGTCESRSNTGPRKRLVNLTVAE